MDLFVVVYIFSIMAILLAVTEQVRVRKCKQVTSIRLIVDVCLLHSGRRGWGQKVNAIMKVMHRKLISNLILMS